VGEGADVRQDRAVKEDTVMRSLTVPALVIAALLGGASAPASTDGGLVSKRSAHTVDQTLDRLEAALKDAGAKIVARLDHTAEAKAIGRPMRPTALVIFGNPAVGAPLMLRNQTIGIDLPMKALAWEDERGQVWLTYNAPGYLAERHGVSGSTEALEAMRKGLERFTDAATRP
jgi:uncharacterized protein (DUF302 family)